MNPVLHGDITNAARALLPLPESARVGACRAMVDAATIAQTHVLRTGQAHPLFGNGTLMSAARKRKLAVEPTFDDIEYCKCLRVVLDALIARSVRQTHKKYTR